jgi:hypothetical protein
MHDMLGSHCFADAVCFRSAVGPPGVLSFLERRSHVEALAPSVALCHI